MTRLALIALAAFTLGGCSILDFPPTTPTGRSFFDIPQTTPTSQKKGPDYEKRLRLLRAARKFREAASEFRNVTSASEVFMNKSDERERLRREQRIDDMLDAYEHQQWLDHMDKYGLRHPY